MLPLLAIVLLSCTPKAKEAPAPLPNPNTDTKPFLVGSAECTPCHADIAEKHSATNHAITLYPATVSALKKLAPAESELSHNMRLRRLGDTLAVEVRGSIGGSSDMIPMAVALGSGKTGMTFMIEDGDSLTEVSRSYFPHQKVWHVTPGQEYLDPTLIGLPHDKTVARKCISCHAVTSPEQPLIPGRKFFGVGCESCHGPGSAHVKGAKISDLKKLDGKAMNSLCGRCHRTAEDAKTLGKVAEGSTNRFQPYGISLSKCFTKSQGKLTCVTCHDPHENASVDIPKYERTCRSCHDGSVKSKPLCPVNAKQGCVRCHMPSKSVFPSEFKLPTGMADHFIRIFKK